jgi:hypothetical protein
MTDPALQPPPPLPTYVGRLDDDPLPVTITRILDEALRLDFIPSVKEGEDPSWVAVDVGHVKGIFKHQ